MMIMMKCFCGMADQWKALTLQAPTSQNENFLGLFDHFLGLVLKGSGLFPTETIVNGSHHHKPPTHREKDLNLHKTWFQMLMNKFVHQW